MTVILGQLFTGISIGAVLLLIALGLSLTFGQMNVINMAHGEFIMAGAYTTYVLQKAISGAGVSLLVALPVAFAGRRRAGRAAGVAADPPPLRPAAGHAAGHLGRLADAAAARPRHLRRAERADPRAGRCSPATSPIAGDLHASPTAACSSWGWRSLAVVALTLALRLTPLGRRIRAVVQNRDLAAVSGIPTGRVDRLTFFIGSGLAGVAGVALTLLGPIGPTMGTNIIIDAFLVVVVGGIGQLKGTRDRRLRARHAAVACVEYSTTRQRREGARLRGHRRVPAVAAAGPVHAAHEEPGMTARPTATAAGARAARFGSRLRRGRLRRRRRPPVRAGAAGAVRLPARACSPSTCASRSSPSASAWPGAAAGCSRSARACSSASAATRWRCT